MSEAVATAPPAGLVLGRYRPLRPLGSGGSGSVWLARDERSGLDVALKIVAREGKAALRAEREATAAARLRHERCLRAYALAHDDDHVYIAYEYVAGRTLRDALREGALTDADAIEAAAQTLEGLAHAHARGIVHRDVKPSNILLEDGDEVAIRLLDFGLARMDDADTLTAVGDVPGTLAYIAPERLQGSHATAASDVWAVGVLLWEALAGGHPFWKPSLIASARAIEAGAPRLRSVRPDLPAPVLAAVDRALALDPGRRPSAAKLAELLRAALRERERRAPSVPALRLPAAPAERAVTAGLAGLASGWTAASLPFFPPAWALPIAAATAAGTALAPRAGLVATLAVPVLPLGNGSLALALGDAAIAGAWRLAFGREARGGRACARGPLLAPLAALALLPLAVQRLRSPARRALATAGAAAAAGAVASVRGSPLPLSGDPPVASLELGRTSNPVAAAAALVDAAAGNVPFLVAGVALAAAAAALPYARARGPWSVAALGAALLATTLLPFATVPALPVVVAVWITCGALWLRPGEHARH